MKKTHFKKYFLHFSLMLFILIGIISCDDNSAGPNGNDNLPPLGSGEFPDEICEKLPNYLLGHSTDITTGHVTYNFLARIVFSIYKFDLINYNTNKLDSNLMYNITAQFDNYHYTFKNVIINDSSLTNLNGYFGGYGKGFPNSQEGIKLNIGSLSNHIEIEENSYVPKIDTNITFLPSFSITNIKNGDTLDASKKIHLNWSGITDEYVNVLIYKRDNFDSNSFRKEVIIKNDGELTILPQNLVNAPNGWYTVCITRNEPYQIDIENKMPISVLVKNSVLKDFYLKH